MYIHQQSVLLIKFEIRLLKELKTNFIKNIWVENDLKQLIILDYLVAIKLILFFYFVSTCSLLTLSRYR